MKVFVTGASGWIGAATVDELRTAGHEVLGLARSEASAAALEAKGAVVVRGELDDLDSLREGASRADGVIHLANKHDWANPAVMNAAEHAAVECLAGALAGSDRPFVVASALSGLAEGRPALETDRSPAVGPDSPRGGSENLALEYAEKGVRVVAARFAPTVHGAGDPGFTSYLVEAARRNGVAGYVGDGSTAWAAVHRADAACVLRLGLESAPAGSVLHVVAEEAVPMRSLASSIGGRLGVPVESVAPSEAATHFGFVARFAGLDMSASSARTRELLGWTPTGPTLAEDIVAGAYGEC